VSASTGENSSNEPRTISVASGQAISTSSVATDAIRS
jgi:hypothetical protein